MSRGYLHHCVFIAYVELELLVLRNDQLAAVGKSIAQQSLDSARHFQVLEDELRLPRFRSSFVRPMAHWSTAACPVVYHFAMPVLGIGTAGVTEKFPQPAKMVAGSGNHYTRGSESTVLTPDGEQRRHADQLRSRTPKDSKDAAARGAKTSATTANKTSPMPAGLADTAPAEPPP
ncbi:hypothetical protein HPB51_001770 [Rhipicephalus microplus]|uniref:Uncharacterized protein n=1 Tax=Rhipicephalus microplus TaxID=6941 RepID=A0A9J6DSB4_RHIMP|nr:hypothetical protein HPB51_001770 [Rhipicephalus microplus]